MEEGERRDLTLGNRIKNKVKNKHALILIIYLLPVALAVSAQASDPAKEIMDRVNDVVCTVLTIFVYLSSGLAAIMIIFAGVKYLMSGDDPEAHSSAKNMVIYAICGLVAVLLACPFVDYLVKDTGITPFSKSCNCIGGGLAGNSTTTTTNPTGGTTTTTIAATNMLTASALVACINSRSGTLEAPATGCPACTFQGMVFTNEAAAPWGPGDVQFNNIPKVDTSTSHSSCPDGLGSYTIPCWTRPGYTSMGGCNDFDELNTFYGCGLAKDTTHPYQVCP